MIRKTTKGYQVVSEKGKPLSEPDMPYKQAEDRLDEIEFFKRVNNATDEGKKLRKKTESNQGQNDPKTIEEMQKRYEMQKSGYKSKPEKVADKMSEGEKKVIQQHFNKNPKSGKNFEKKELPPVKQFESLKSKLDTRHQKALDKVLGK